MNISNKRANQFLSDLNTLLDSESEVENKFEDLFKLFYQLVKHFTQIELTAFRNFYARFKYLLANLNFSEQERRDLDAFRQFVRVNKRTLLREELFQPAVSMLLLIIDRVAPSDEFQKVRQRLRQYQPGTFSQLFPARNYENVKDIKVMAAKWGEVTGNGNDRSFTLSAYDLENLDGEVTIDIQQHSFGDFMYLRELLEESMILYFQNLSVVDGKQNAFKTSFKSLIAIEPDFLIDATAIGSCFNNSGYNSDSFFLARLVDNLPGQAALKGSLVGYYLDEMVRNRKAFDGGQVFRDGQRNNAMKAAQFGTQAMQKMKREIEQEHLAYIQHLVEREKGKTPWIEPTYFSKDFGLQGRIDLLGINEGTDAKDIVELKSGRPSNPNYGVAWENHKMQVVCYDMALDSTYGPDRTGTAAVYYSKSIGNPAPFRNIVSEYRERAQVLKVRNEIAAKIYSLASNDFSTLDQIKLQGIPHLPKYNETELQQFQRIYDPNTIAAHYYRELLAFTLRELINAKVGDLLSEEENNHHNGFAGLWLDSLMTKEKDYGIIYGLQLEQVDKESAHIELAMPEEDRPHSFRQGDLVIFYPRTKNGYNALDRHILKGSIKELDLRLLTISLYNKQTDYSFIEEHEIWAIEPDIFERNYWSTISCLLNILSSSKDKKAILFGHREPAFDTKVHFNDPALTDNQNEVLKDALNADNYYLLQGPPGTGKTSTFLVNFVREKIRQTNEKIVVLAFTNKAVDKICENFRKPRTGPPIGYLRFGSKHVEDDGLFRSAIEEEPDDPDRWRQIIESHRVFVSTVATFQNRWLLLQEFINYETVVIDEASQLTEAAISGVLALFNKFVLIGDHKQLPAVVTQAAKTCLTNSHYLHQLGIKDLRVSLFERLFRNAEAKGWHRAIGQLTSHYRMHESIAILITGHYPKPLKAEKEKQKSMLPAYLFPDTHPLSLLTASRIVFIETPPEAALKKNAREAKIAAFIVQTLIDEIEVSPKEIGIITPFRAQIAEIKKCLREDLLQDVIVDTVERYQGDERKIILFSTTIADARQVRTLENISPDDEKQTDRKLLVSVSRASEQLIVLGNSKALTASPHYSEMMALIIEQNGYIGRAWAEDVLSSQVNDVTSTKV